MKDKDPIDIAIGRFLKDWRDSEAMTQEKFAEYLGWTENYYSKVERGVRKNSFIKKIYNFSKRTGISLDTLVKKIDEEFNKTQNNSNDNNE